MIRPETAGTEPGTPALQGGGLWACGRRAGTLGGMDRGWAGCETETGWCR